MTTNEIQQKQAVALERIANTLEKLEKMTKILDTLERIEKHLAPELSVEDTYVDAEDWGRGPDDKELE